MESSGESGAVLVAMQNEPKEVLKSHSHATMVNNLRVDRAHCSSRRAGYVAGSKEPGVESLSDILSISLVIAVVSAKRGHLQCCDESPR